MGAIWRPGSGDTDPEKYEIARLEACEDLSGGQEADCLIEADG
jgi:hypothetical protein